MVQKRFARRAKQQPTLREEMMRLVQRHGLADVRKALRRCGKIPGARKWLNEIRTLTVWAEIEFWRHQWGEGNKPLGALPTCTRLAAKGGIAVPYKLQSGGVGDLAYPGKAISAEAKSTARYRVLTSVDNLRRYHSKGEELLRDTLPPEGAAWWREFALDGCAVAK